MSCNYPDRSRRVLRAASTLAGAALLFTAIAAAQTTPPDPVPASDGPANIFYGSVLPTATSGPILVFVHGLNGTASDWWLNEDAGTPNLMYSMAYAAGYRTAFISLNADNSRNNLSWQDNGAVLKGDLQTVYQHFNNAKFYVVGHSEGGLDIEAAMLNPQYTALDTSISAMIKAVFTVATPNQGTALADWAFGPGLPIAGPLGLATPAVQSLEVATVEAFRTQADPVFAASGIQFYTFGGNSPGGGAKPSPILNVTSLILDKLAPGANDGLVPLSSIKLPYSYAMNVGQNAYNHFLMLEGPNTFPTIDGQVQGLERELAGFRKIATGGFGDDSNTFAWSEAWFNHKLYIGTGREVRCVSVAAGDVQNGTHSYPPHDGSCPADKKDLRLQAEIWQYTPETHTWLRVYQSPATIPLGNDEAGNPAFAALDIGYRGMTVFTEPDGTQALYVAGVSGGEIYGNLPGYTFQTYPAPRILRSTDGVNFAPIPQSAGTFLGDISKNAPSDANVFGFRALTSYKGQLFATAGNYFGNGVVIASANPAAGGDAWFAAGPDFDHLPAWDMSVFNGSLYVVGGNSANEAGYFVSKTDASGNPPYTFTNVVTQGGSNAPGTKEALSMAIFNNSLYVGTDGPTELIRVNTDDSWDLIIGTPRSTPQGTKAPLSGIGEFFDNQFNRHFWRIGVVPSGAHAGIYFTTYDWGVQLTQLWEFADLVNQDFGTDIYYSPNGVQWSAVSTTGFGDGANYGVRTIDPNPFGTFMGTGRFVGGLQIWADQTVLDYNNDGTIDQKDVELLTARIGQTASGPNDPMDIDEDGAITANDARKLVTQCANPGCAVTPVPVILPNPTNLVAAPQATTPNTQLTWDAVPGAVRYHVYRQPQTPLLDLFPPGGITIKILGFPLTIPEDLLNGTFDKMCSVPMSKLNPICDIVGVFKLADLPNSTIGFPGPLVEVAVTSATTFTETAPTRLQSVYFVRAEDAAGNRSGPSNLAGAPSLAPAVPQQVESARTRAREVRARH